MIRIPRGYPLASSHPLGRVNKRFIALFIIGMLISGCSKISIVPSSGSSLGAVPTSSPTLSLVPATSPANAFHPTPEASPTPIPIKVWLAPYLPPNLLTSIALPDGYNLAAAPDQAGITISVAGKDITPSIDWVYALVAPFPTVTDGITSDELHAYWIGESGNLFNDSPLLMDESTLDVLTAYWGSPATDSVQVLPADQLLDYAWSNRPAWAIIPFENLEPRWKVLMIDGISPIHKDFDPASYLLTIPFAITGDPPLPPEALGIPASNRDPSWLTTIAMTGVTAMVRATAYTMESQGITYPAQDIGPLLSQADITHISNEIPFSPDCPFPSPTMPDLVFCSRPAYIDLLKAVGTDVVELTGDHFMDYGAEATLYTLDMYKNLGWPYYGGGANATDARQPALFENNGNKIAFMGCNIGCTVKNEIPCDAIASGDHPGASECDFNALSTEIPALREQGYSVIFTFQHREYYTYTTAPILADDFGLVSAAGASIVSGSQAHQAHGFAFQNGSFIHYGLGNLFFDQYHYCVADACDYAFIDRHVFYAGKYISTELITIRFVDYARPRLMTPNEREQFLDMIFRYSGW